MTNFLASSSAIAILCGCYGVFALAMPQQQQQFQSRNTYDLANRGAYLPLGESQLAALEGGSAVSAALLLQQRGDPANLHGISQPAPGQHQQQQLHQDSYALHANKNNNNNPQQQQPSDAYQGERIPGEYSAVDSYAAYNNYQQQQQRQQQQQ